MFPSVQWYRLILAPVLLTCLQASLLRGQEARVVEASGIYYGIPIEESGVAFLLDVSGSMEGKDEGVGTRRGLLNRAIGEAARAARRTRLGQSGVGGFAINRAESETTKLGSARRELFRAIGSLTGLTQFTIVTFGTEAKEWPGGMRLAGRTERTAAQGYALSIGSAGGTPMAEAIRTAFAQQRVKVIFLVSDGRPTTGEVRSLVRQLQQSRHGEDVIINTVGIGDDQDSGLLCELARENHGVYVNDGRVECSANPCPPEEIVTFFRPGHPKHHHYSQSTQICRVGPSCSPEEVYALMISSARFQAPTLETHPIRDCSRLSLRVAEWANVIGGAAGNLLDPDPVLIDLAPETLTATNYTLPGHRFHPGRVTRTVYRQGDQVMVRSVGEGTGPYPIPNQTIGPRIFSAVDRDLIQAVARQRR